MAQLIEPVTLDLWVMSSRSTLGVKPILKKKKRKKIYRKLKAMINAGTFSAGDQLPGPHGDEWKLSG